VLLLDEHVAALDPNSARALMAETNTLIGQLGITTLMVTHDMGRALEHSDRLLMMHRGSVIMDLAGAEKDHMAVADLVRRFEGDSGSAIPDRSMLT
jgi:putative ABC transport system ATP-binding protein